MSVIKSQKPGFPAGGSSFILESWFSISYIFCRSWFEMKGIILNWAWLMLNFLLSRSVISSLSLNFLLSRSVIFSQSFSSMSLQLEFLIFLRVSSFSTGRSSSSSEDDQFSFCSRSSEAWKQAPVVFMVIP